jgi:PKD repeat protein
LVDDTGVTGTTTFSSAGTYQVTLTVVDDDNISNSTTRSVQVNTTKKQTPPSPSFSIPTSSPTAGSQVVFDASGSVDPDGTIQSYEWDFDGDGLVDDTGVTGTTTFSSPGSYQVTLTAVDNDNVANSTTKTVQIGGANGSSGVRLTPTEKTVTVGDTTTYDIVLTETQTPIGAYNYTVTTTNVSNATISDFEFAGSPITELVTFGSDNSSVTAAATQASVSPGTDVIIGTVKIKAEAVGTANLSINVNDIVDTQGTTIPINKVSGGSLTIERGTSQTLRFDPAAQSVTPGGTTTFDLVVPNASSGISTYDYTIRTNDSSTANITAVQPGGSPASSTLNIDYAPDNSSVAVTGGFAKITPGTNVSIGTVTVSGAVNGTAELSARVGPVIDANNDPIAITGAESATVAVSGTRVVAPGDLTGDGQAATDPDNDGVYEDINGDGSADLRDLQPFFDLIRPSAATPQTSALDMNGDGIVDLRDLQPFFNEVRP